MIEIVNKCNGEGDMNTNRKSQFLKLIVTLILILNFGESLKAEVNTESIVQYPSLRAYYFNYKAQKALENKNPELALQYLLRVLETESQNAQIFSNLGIAFDHLKKTEESEKAHKQALSLLESHIAALREADKFQIFYNLGVFYGSQNKVEEALNFYQRALDINPTSQEIKHNIELLIQQQKQQQQQQSGQSQNQDQKDQNKNNEKDQKENNNQKDNKDQNKNDDKDQNKDRSQTPKYQPRPFKGDQLTEGDVKKILGELSEQDKKIRSNFNKKERKEGRNDKDW